MNKTEIEAEVASVRAEFREKGFGGGKRKLPAIMQLKSTKLWPSPI